MGTLLNYLDKEIEERKQELQEKKGETLAVQDWELIGLIREIAEKQAERDKLTKKPL